MKKFVFQMEDILDFYKYQQQEAEVELGKVLTKENEYKTELENLAKRKVSVNKTSSTDINSIISINNFSSYIEKKSELIMNEMVELKIKIEEKRDILKKIMQKVNALENLKSEQLKEYKEQEKIEEENLIDDIVTSRFKI